MEYQVLTYEALACKEGLELLEKLFPCIDPEFKHNWENSNTKPTIKFERRLNTIVSCYFFSNLTSYKMPNNWQLILMGVDLNLKSSTFGQNFGHSFKGKQTVFIPKPAKL